MSTTSAASSPLDWLAKAISALTHPVLIPFGFFLLASPLHFAYTSIWEPVLAFLILLIAPLGASLLYFKKHNITDIFVVDKKHRPLPFAFNIIGLLGFSFFIPPQAMALGYELMLLPWLGSFLVANVLAMIITLKWKISLHMMGMGLASAWLATFLWGDTWYWLIMAGLLVLTLAVGWARKHLRSHDLPQLAAGWALGISIVAIIGFLIAGG